MKNIKIKIFLVAIIAIASLFIYKSNKIDRNFTDLALSNIEALASDELELWDCWYYGCVIDYSYNCSIYVGGRYLRTCPNRRG